MIRTFTLALLLFPVLLSAQITLDQADMPSAGDTMRYWNGLLTSFDAADTGPNHVWDFTGLGPLTEGADTAVTVGSTPFLYQFFFNNPFLYPDHDADYAVKGQEFGFQQLQVSDVYDYFKKGSSGFRNVGFGANINGLPSSIRRLPVDYVYRFPMTYGDVDSSFSTWEVDVPTIFHFEQEQWRYNEVDGWGVLYLPTDTFTVLRVRSVLQRTDSIYIDQFGIGFSLPEPQTVEYKWLAVGEGYPVLQVNTLAGLPVLTRFRYDMENIPTSLPEAAVGDLDPFPNPASDIVHVRMPEGVSGDLVLTDAAGREVRRVLHIRAKAVVAVDLGGLPGGVYDLRIDGNGGRWNGRLVVE